MCYHANWIIIATESNASEERKSFESCHSKSYNRIETTSILSTAKIYWKSDVILQDIHDWITIDIVITIIIIIIDY